MAGGEVTYSLRPNKYVERRLFVDLLSLICDKPKDAYLYISMGGPQLVDHRLVHYHLGIKKLLSIEIDEVIYKRQLYNLRPGCIDCKLMSVDELIADFPSIDQNYPNEDYIIWLDYAAANERYSQLSEFQSLIGTLNENDFIKITINANVTTLGERGYKQPLDDLRSQRFSTVKRQLSEYFDEELFDEVSITRNGFVKILRRAIQIALVKGLRNDHFALPVLSFVYQDGPHLMLNVGFKLFSDRNVMELVRTKLFQDWNYLPDCEQYIHRINIPDLSVKERLLIDSKMFKENHDNIHDNLPFRLSVRDVDSKQILKQYFDHYQRYPFYADVYF